MTLKERSGVRGQELRLKYLPHIHTLKAGTHWPNCWTSEAFGETRMRSGTNMFGVFSCAGSFRGWRTLSAPIQHAKSEEVGCRPSEPLDSLIGGVLANQHGVWEGLNTMCTMFFYALRSVIHCFHGLEYWQETSCNVRSGQINLCSFGNALLHV